MTTQIKSELLSVASIQTQKEIDEELEEDSLSAVGSMSVEDIEKLLKENTIEITRLHN